MNSPASEREPVNRRPIEISRGTAEAIGGIFTRRQMIVWGAIALGGLAITPIATLVEASAESNTDGRKTDAQVSQRDIYALSKASVIYIATVRKDGNQSTLALVWFSIASVHEVLIQTRPTTWKAKRIRRGSPVIVWIGKRNG